MLLISGFAQVSSGINPLDCAVVCGTSAHDMNWFLLIFNLILYQFYCSHMLLIRCGFAQVLSGLTQCEMDCAVVCRWQ